MDILHVTCKACYIACYIVTSYTVMILDLVMHMFYMLSQTTTAAWIFTIRAFVVYFVMDSINMLEQMVSVTSKILTLLTLMSLSSVMNSFHMCFEVWTAASFICTNVTNMLPLALGCHWPHLFFRVSPHSESTPFLSSTLFRGPAAPVPWIIFQRQFPWRYHDPLLWLWTFLMCLLRANANLAVNLHCVHWSILSFLTVRFTSGLSCFTESMGAP